MFNAEGGFDTSFGIYLDNDKFMYVDHDDIIFNNVVYTGTPGLWPLVTKMRPTDYYEDDLNSYWKLMLQTNALHQDFNPENKYEEEFEVEGLVFVKYTVIDGKLYLHEKGRCYRV